VIRQRIKEAKAKQKEAYDAKQRKGVKKHTFTEGDVVLLRNSKKDGRKGGRLTADWTGPYTIKTMLGKGLCILASSDGKELKAKHNVARIKPYLERDVSQATDADHPGHGMLSVL